MDGGQTRLAGIWWRVAAGVAVVLWGTGSVSTVRGEEPGVVWLDLDSQSQRQVVVDREAGVYLGHPSTLLLEDGRTILCVYPQGHGRGAIIYKRSEDGGLSWSERLPTPANWATSQETPTLFRITDAGGRRRVVLFSGLYPIRTSISADDGRHWSELAPVGEWGGIVAMGSMISVRDRPGEYLALFHDDGRYIDGHGDDGGTFTLYSSRSTDGGVTWGRPETIYQSSDVHLCEPGSIRSPDGRQIAVLLRENRRVQNSHVMFSDDEGQTWTAPRPLPAILNGDRHVGRYGPDGRLFISFRDVPPREQQSPTAGDWVGWVGTYEDLVQGRPGQYRVRLKDNQRQADCAYPGVELLPDGTFVVTTYGHWVEGESPYILSVRFTLSELDQLARTPR